MRKVLKDSRRLAQKISGEKSVQKEATACAEVLWQGVCPACPRDPKGTSMAGEDKTAVV